MHDGAVGVGGEQAEPHEESGEAGGEYESAGASAASAGVALRHSGGMFDWRGEGRGWVGEFRIAIPFKEIIAWDNDICACTDTALFNFVL